jgi:hypothetical protein
VPTWRLGDVAFYGNPEACWRGLPPSVVCLHRQGRNEEKERRYADKETVYRLLAGTPLYSKAHAKARRVNA